MEKVRLRSRYREGSRSRKPQQELGSVVLIGSVVLVVVVVVATELALASCFVLMHMVSGPPTLRVHFPCMAMGVFTPWWSIPVPFIL